jgi:hypothetical protein
VRCLYVIMDTSNCRAPSRPYLPSVRYSSEEFCFAKLVLRVPLCIRAVHAARVLPPDTQPFQHKPAILEVAIVTTSLHTQYWEHALYIVLGNQGVASGCWAGVCVVLCCGDPKTIVLLLILSPRTHRTLHKSPQPSFVGTSHHFLPPTHTRHIHTHQVPIRYSPTVTAKFAARCQHQKEENT